MLNETIIVGVCGAGAMGAGIAQVAAQAGHKVVVLDQNDEALGRGRAVVAKGAEALLKRGKISEDEAKALNARVEWTTAVAALGDCGLIIEAIIERADAKQGLFAKLEEATGGRAVLATNTSSLSVTSLAASLKRPKAFMGLHFFNPAPVMKLVEVVCGMETDQALADEALQLMEGWGKVAVKARDVPGFIVNRVARPYYGEGWRAFEEGAADPASLDFLYRDLAGFRMGPFELGDLIGHDINTAAAKSVYDSYFGRTRFVPSLAQGQLAAAGMLGRKTGKGVYDYSEGASAPAPVFVHAVDKPSATLRLSSDAEALKALLAAAGVPYAEDKSLPPGYAELDGVLIGFTCGRTASDLRAEFGKRFALIDWVRDAKSASALGLAGCCNGALKAGLAFAALCGKKAITLKDRPGLVVFRTLLQLANCAGDTVRDLVADAESIDRAMINGVNYPFGPMAWAKEFGFARVVEALDAIADETGEALYRPSEALRALARNE